MDWQDISVPIRDGMVTFDGDPVVHLERVKAMADGAICNVSRLDFGLHSGTHIDAPVHFIDGASGIEGIPLDPLVGPALWEKRTFDRSFVAVTGDGATALVERGLRLIGADYLSIAPFDAPTPTHEILLGAGVIIVEGLDLRTIEPGWYDFICLPLLIPGSDGGPARAIVRRRAA